MKIATNESLNRFAEKVAERTGLSQQNVAHVLATAMIVSSEEIDEDHPQRQPDKIETEEHGLAG